MSNANLNIRNIEIELIVYDFDGVMTNNKVIVNQFGNESVIVNRSDGLSFIYAADVLILPTRAEALPRVILEAMALKTPIIATDVDGIPELIENEVDGLLIPPDNSEKLIEAIKWMYKNNEDREKFAEVAHKKYWSYFSRNHQIKRYANLIDELSKNKN